MELSARERLIATVEFEPVDRPVRWEGLGFWKETLERWHGEGLPVEIKDELTAHVHNGFDLQLPVFMGAHEHAGPDPLFTEEIVSQDPEYTVKRHVGGAVMRVFTDGSSTPPHFIDFPVKDRPSWEEYKLRLDPKTPGRLAPWKPFIELAKAQPWPLIVYLPGLFGTHRHLLGVEALMVGYYDRPELIHEISRQWVKLWKGVLAKIAALQRPDMVALWEDMCGRNGPLIGPKTFAEFMSPYYKELIDFARRELGVPIVGVDTDGELTPLIGKFVEAGVNMLWPFEVQAGMDVLKARAGWPRAFAIMGGMDKRALARGRVAIDAEVSRVLGPMLAAGGYIPAVDHTVPPDVPLSDWLYFRDLVRARGTELAKGKGASV